MKNVSNQLDSIEHTFLDCLEFSKLLDASLQWLDKRHSIVLTISPYAVILNQVPTSPQLSFSLMQIMSKTLISINPFRSPPVPPCIINIPINRPVTLNNLLRLNPFLSALL